MRLIALVIVGKHADEIGELLSPEQAATEPERPERLEVAEFAFEDRYQETADKEAGSEEDSD